MKDAIKPPYEWNLVYANEQIAALTRENAALKATNDKMHQALKEVDRWSLVIDSAVRHSDPTNEDGVWTMLDHARAALAGRGEEEGT